MRNFQRIGQVNVVPLLNAIMRRPELWKEDTYLRDYPQGPFGEVDTIMLRFPVKSVKETQAEVEQHLLTHDPHESVDYPPFKILPEARNIVFGLMAEVQGERLGRVMINRIAPGGRIFPHADTPLHCEYYSRYHVCLQSGPGYVFRCGEEKVRMDQGEIYWFNNAIEHEVQNNAAIDRISMVVDIRTSRP